MDLLLFRADKSVSEGVLKKGVSKNEARSIGLTLLDELGVDAGANGRDEHRMRGPGRLEKQIKREPRSDHRGVRKDPPDLRRHQRQPFADTRADRSRHGRVRQRSHGLPGSVDQLHPATVDQPADELFDEERVSL